MEARTEVGRTPGGGGPGVTEKVVVGGTVSTGMVLGGYVVAATTLAGRMNANGLILTSFGLFIVGAAVGLVASALLGLVGREAGSSAGGAARRVLRGALYAVPACVVGAILASWIAMAIMVLYVGRAAPIAFSALGALAGAGVIAATFRVTCACCGNAVRRLRGRPGLRSLRGPPGLRRPAGPPRGSGGGPRGSGGGP